MHYKRLIVALVLIPVLYLYTMYLPPHYYLFLLTLFSTIALIEFYALSGVRGLLRYAGVFWGAVLLTVTFFFRDYFVGVLFLSVAALASLRLFLRRDPAGATSETAAVVFGLLYIPGLLSFQLSLVKVSAALVAMLYAAVWGSDSMAYYIGKNLGKKKLYPEMSPNKTVEGAVGSLLGGIIGALLIKFTLLSAIPFPRAALLGLAIGGSTIIGDLVESMFKRDAGVKDSSNIIPGHGGVLDKIDSVLFAGPAFYAACLALNVIG